MPRKAVVTGTSKKHRTKKEAAIQEQVYESWRRGNLSDYEPKNLTPEGLVIFGSLAKAMPENALAEVDGYTLETAADAIDQMRICREHIKKEGTVVRRKNGNGQVVQRLNDYVTVYKQYADIAKRFLVELGLTPSARSKIASDAALEAARPQSLRDILAEDE